MKKISATTIYPITSEPIDSGLIITKDDGEILEILNKENAEYEHLIKDALHIDGVICPGFINAHCHLELSYLKGILPEKKGLVSFIKSLQKHRKTIDFQKISDSIAMADSEMYDSGIVAVGDICNGTDSLYQKLKSRIYYHSFIEVFAFSESKAEAAFSEGLRIQKKFADRNLPCSLVPHAPYSTSIQLIKMISDYAALNQAITCIHNQESEAENLLFQNKSGELIQMLKEFGINMDDFDAKKCSSLAYYHRFFNSSTHQMFVHNTYSNEQDIKAASNKNVFWCLCPNANIFIENQLPKIELFRNAGVSLTIGTDSLASNHQLCVWEEIKTIQKHYADIDLSEILEWGTINGAKYLGIESRYGSLEKGKNPGLVAIENNNKPRRLI